MTCTHTMTCCTAEDCVEFLSCIDDVRRIDASSTSPPPPLVDDLETSLQRMHPAFMDPTISPSTPSKRKWPFRRTSVPQQRIAKTPTMNVQSRKIAEETSDHARPMGTRTDAADNALSPALSPAAHTAQRPASSRRESVDLL